MYIVFLISFFHLYEKNNNLLYEKYIFNNSGIYNFSIPIKVSLLEVKLWGSAGASPNSGAGGYSYCIINVSNLSNLMIQVGGPNIFLLNNWRNRSGSGERSSIYIESITNELIVAGGGGAGVYSNGGAGGGINGENGNYYLNSNPSVCGTAYTNGGGGGTQIAGGNAGTATTWSGCYSTGVSGKRNYGSRGHGKLDYWEGGSGGGGYFGGGSGGSTCHAHGGGGGGSGFILQSPIIINGTTIRGNNIIPGNHNDIDRYTSGSPGYSGSVMIKFISPNNFISKNVNFKYISIYFIIFPYIF